MGTHPMPAGQALPAVSTPYRLAFWAGRMAMLMLAIAVYLDTAESLISVWRSSPTYHHCFLVVPFCAALVWARRRRLASVPVVTEWLSLPAVAAAAAVWAIGTAGGWQLFQHAGFSLLLVALLFMLFGRQVFRECWFPFLFLVFLTPFGDEIVPLLREITTLASYALLQMLAVPVVREGFYLEAPFGIFFVAEACAGVRFLIANVVVGVVFAYFYLKSIKVAGVYLVLCAVTPVAANILRVFTIILIARMADDRAAQSVDHIVYGWGFFAVVMFASMLIGLALSKRLPVPGAAGVLLLPEWPSLSRLRPARAVVLWPLGLLAAAAGPMFLG